MSHYGDTNTYLEFTDNRIQLVSGGTTKFDSNNTYLTSIPSPTSGDWWNNGYVMVQTDGVAEVGKYIDFHNTDAATSDFDTRLYSSGSNQLTINGSGRILTTADALDADTLDSKDHTSFGATLATYGTTGGASGRIRCTAPFNTNSGHMFQVTISVYSSYTCHTYVVSGYMYSTTNQWYVPKCVYTGTGTPDIVVGRDGNGKAYISLANGNYTGVRVHNMTRGYQTSVADTYAPWTITIDGATENSVTPTVSTVWHSNNDGSGSGLDADLLDGLQGDFYFKSHTNNNGGWSQSNRNFSVRTGGNAVGLHMEESDGTFGLQLYADGSNYGFLESEWGAWDLKKVTNGKLYINDDTTYYLQPESTSNFNTLNVVTAIASDAFRSNLWEDNGGTFLFKKGSGSGRTRHLNLANSTGDPASVADSSNPTGISWGQRSDNNAYYMLGLKGSYNNGYSTHSRLTLGWHTGIEIGANATYGGVRFFADSPFLNTTEIMQINSSGGHVKVTNNLYANGGGLVWNANNDGPDSGLDADTLDGNQASAFLGVTSKAADSEKLDGLDSTDFRQYTWRSFSVAGDLDKFYPVLFSVGNGHHASSDLEIAQSNVHQNGSGHGAFYARFGLNITGWGHIPQMLTLREYSKTGQTYISKIADTDHATGQIGIWLRGSTTYYYRCSDGAIFDSVRCENNQPFKSYDNANDVYDITITHATSVENAMFDNSAHNGKVLNTGNIAAYAWTSSNDGPDSGLDADTLDGQQLSYVMNYDNLSNKPSNIGNSDTVDGVHAASLLRSDVADTIDNNIVITQRGEFTTGTSGQNNSRQSNELSYSFGYQFGGSWTGPYPDLILGYHTGVRIGGHSSYGGTRFYQDHPSRVAETAEIFSVGNGDNHVRATGNIYAYTSDRRLKENFRPIENAIDKVRSLGGYLFDWREDMMAKHGFQPDQVKDDAGVIAQDVQEVLPAAVQRAPFDFAPDKKNHSESGEEFLTVQYEKMVPLLIEAIKEQQDQIDELKKLLENK